MVGSYTIERWPHPNFPDLVRPLLAEGLAQGFEWLGRFEPEWTRHPFINEGEALFLAMQNGEAIAMASMRKSRFIDAPRNGRLGFIFVGEQARRRGIAEALVIACLEHAEPFWDTLSLHTDNPVAEALYLRHGFVHAPDAGEHSTHLRFRR